MDTSRSSRPVLKQLTLNLTLTQSSIDKSDKSQCIVPNFNSINNNNNVPTKSIPPKPMKKRNQTRTKQRPTLALTMKSMQTESQLQSTQIQFTQPTLQMTQSIVQPTEMTQPNQQIQLNPPRKESEDRSIPFALSFGSSPSQSPHPSPESSPSLQPTQPSTPITPVAMMDSTPLTPIPHLELDGSTAATAIPLTPEETIVSQPVQKWNWNMKSGNLLARSVSVGNVGLPPPAARRPTQQRIPFPTHAAMQVSQDTMSRTSSIGSISCSQFEDYCTPQDQPVHTKNDIELKEDLMYTRQPIKKMKTSLDNMNSLAADLPVGYRGTYSSSEMAELDTFVNPFLPVEPIVKKTNKHKRSATVFPVDANSSKFVSEFEHVHQLGKGSFGDVLQCRHRYDRSMYAIKIIRRKIMGAKQRSLVATEVHALAALQCAPNCPTSIVRYVTAWEEQGTLYIQTEYCPGGNLSTRLLNGPQLTIAELDTIALQMAQALQHVHANGMAHMDVKPDNMLQHSPGSYRLSDFGCACLLTSRVDPEVGDKRYLPPDAYDHTIVHLHALDMYSLGISMYELASGEPLPTSSLQMYRIQIGDISNIETKVSPVLYECIREMLHPHPTNRMTSAQVVHALLNRNGN